jgi:hypothetical protein
MLNMSLVAAAALTVSVGVVHSWLGEKRLIGPLLAPEKRHGILAASAFSRGVLRFAWHVTTLAWWGLAAILAALARVPVEGVATQILLVIAVMFGITGLIVLIGSRGRHLSWPVFLAIAALSAGPAMV